MQAWKVESPQVQVDRWNGEHAVGIEVEVRKDNGEIVKTRTRSAASVLSGHTAVIFLEGISGCYLLRRVTAIGEVATPDTPRVRLDLLKELMGTTCRCGRAKHSRKTFCLCCYDKLPPAMQRALYRRFGAGYEEAYDAAVAQLQGDSGPGRAA